MGKMTLGKRKEIMMSVLNATWYEGKHVMNPRLYKSMMELYRGFPLWLRLWWNLRSFVTGLWRRGR